LTQQLCILKKCNSKETSGVEEWRSGIKNMVMKGEGCESTKTQPAQQRSGKASSKWAKKSRGGFKDKKKKTWINRMMFNLPQGKKREGKH